MRTIVTTVVALLIGAGAASAQDATATLINPQGEEIGRAELTETPNRGVLIRVEVEGLEPGAHGFHIHETGQCEAPEFSSAGGHFAPRGHSHGVLHPEGAHAGDLLNLHVPESGQVTTERLAEHVTLGSGEASLFDDDGAALVIHANPDDYQSQPAGGGGTKVACGVITR